MITVIAREPLSYRGQEVGIGETFEIRPSDALVLHHRGQIAWPSERALVREAVARAQEIADTPDAPAPAPDEDDEEPPEQREPDEPPVAPASEPVETPRRRGRSRYRRSEADVERTTDLIADK